MSDVMTMHLFVTYQTGPVRLGITSRPPALAELLVYYVTPITV